MSMVLAAGSAATHDAEPRRVASERLLFLDALRGVAIVLVLLFHAFVRWPDVVPYHDRFAGVPLFAYGWLGVHLFFMISGFVILMTLERSRSYAEFMVRRWLRLFPAMLGCSAIIFSTAPVLSERPLGRPALRDLLPGLTFIEPSWWGTVLRSHQGVLEGAFWSLFVEMKFYLLIGALYFAVGRAAALICLFAAFALSAAVTHGAFLLPSVAVETLSAVLRHASAEYYGWFTAGALYYCYFRTPDRRLLVMAILVASAAAITVDTSGLVSKIMASIVVGAFTAAVVLPRARSLLNAPILLFLGFVSYPLYLLHENMMVSFIVKTDRALPTAPAVLLPLASATVIVAVAWVVARYVEPGIRDLLLGSRRCRQPLPR